MARPNFKHQPEIRKRATEASKGVKRPNRKGKRQIEHEAKVQLAMKELVRNGYEAGVRENMPSVLKAHWETAGKKGGGSTQERKLFFQNTGLLEKEPEANTSVGTILAELFRNVKLPPTK